MELIDFYDVSKAIINHPTHKSMKSLRMVYICFTNIFLCHFFPVFQSLAKWVETTTSGATLFPAVFHFNKTSPLPRCRCLLWIEQIPSQDIQDPRYTNTKDYQSNSWLSRICKFTNWGTMRGITTLRIPTTGDISNHGTMRQLLSLFSRPLSWQRNI